MPIRAENKSRYPADWPEISRRIRFDRAGGRCECRGECLIHAAEGRRRTDTHLGPDGRCEAVHGALLPSGRWRVILTVAHLDHTPEHCDDLNLLALCAACHLRYDGPHHAETRRAVLADADAGAQLLF